MKLAPIKTPTGFPLEVLKSAQIHSLWAGGLLKTVIEYQRTGTLSSPKWIVLIQDGLNRACIL